MRSSVIVSITKYDSNNQIMKDVMGEACSTCGEEERLHTGKRQRKRHMEDLGVSENLMLKWILK